MNVTNFLLAVILFVLVKQFYPQAVETLGPLIFVAATIYCCYWLVAKLPGQWRQRNAAQQQEQEDEKAFWELQRKCEAVRSKYDPNHEWNEATSRPKEYLHEIKQLNREYREMLQRRNGWTAGDFQ